MSVECQVNIKFQSELDIGGLETFCYSVFIVVIIVIPYQERLA